VDAPGDVSISEAQPDRPQTRYPLDWWAGLLFALGSLLFVLASAASLSPGLAKLCSLDTGRINATFFAGSIPFTTAAYLLVFQAANSHRDGEDSPDGKQTRRLIGWRPHDLVWLGCFLQFVGTILFNFNTFDAMLSSLAWVEQDLLIWAPGFVGSVLFLASGSLAFRGTCGGRWAWNPTSRAWWIDFVNLFGCAGFMVSAVLTIVLPGAPNLEAVDLSLVFTLFGASAFLLGSLLMLRRS